MKLRDKFKLPIDAYNKINNHVAEQCEQIADKYAIAFGEYLDSLTTEDMGDLTIKELLGIFKKEKGL